MIAGDANPSITNKQEAGVDEGDIVKQIGQYLIVMQDGRLFSIDLLPDGEPGLRYVDRQNVYTTTEEDTWYDEMLVFGRQMLVIGYSYEAEASVFAVLELEETGEITFLELNLNCNLWSQKVFGRAAIMAGWTQEQLIETLLAEGLQRHGLI